MDRRRDQENAQRKGAPQERVSGDLVAQQTGTRPPHVEDVPELTEGKGQERYSQGGMVAHAERAERDDERAERRAGEQEAIEADRKPVPTPQDRLLRISRRPPHHVGIPLPDRE